MAKYVLLSFDSDEEANAFTRYVERNDPNTNYLGYEVVAEFKKPTQFCQCTPEQRRGKLGKTGQKYGWYVCGNCMKPAKGGGQTIPNLLEMDLPPWRRQIHLQVRCEYAGWLEPGWTPPQLVKKGDRQ